MANHVVSLALDQFQVEGDDFARGASEAVHVGHFPMTQIRHLFNGEVFAIVFDGIVDAMSELFSQEGNQLLPPELRTVPSGFDGTAEISKHGQGAEGYHDETRLTIITPVEKLQASEDVNVSTHNLYQPPQDNNST